MLENDTRLSILGLTHDQQLMGILNRRGDFLLPFNGLVG